MLHMTMVMEDTIIIAQVNVDNKWEGQCTDTHAGKTHNFVWTFIEMACVTALAHGAGEEKGLTAGAVEQLYEIANKAIAEFPPEIRPIP